MLNLCIPTEHGKEEVLVQVEMTAHPFMGPVLEVNSTIKDNQVETDSVVLPLNTITLNALQALHDCCGRFLDETDSQDGSLSQHRPRSQPPTSFFTLFSQVGCGSAISTHNLDQPINQTPFLAEDLVFALQNNRPFAKEIIVPLKLVKLILFWGFQGKPPLSTQEIEALCLRLNILFDFCHTEKLLAELAHDELIHIEERETKAQQSFPLWVFNTIPRDHLLAQGEIGGMVEISWQFRTPTTSHNGGKLVLPLNPRTVSFLEVLTRWGATNLQKNLKKLDLSKVIPVDRIQGRIQELEL